MGYCTSCGAYVPDGQTKCLACGFDENAEKEQTSTASGASAAAAQKAPEQERSQRKYRQFDSEELRRQLEEQRKRQQQNSRKWAETEYAQRQKVKEEQARNFQNTSGTSRENTNTNTYTDTVRGAVQSADLSKLMAGMSYVSVLFLIPMLLGKNDSFVAYHAKQGMKLFLAGLIGRIAASLLGLGWLVTAAQVYLAYIGIQNVLAGRRKPLPYVGDLLK